MFMNHLKGWRKLQKFGNLGNNLLEKEENSKDVISVLPCN
jgi:uncharacterized protein YlbG (UPF0298 family)